jgi:hypothetical protein
LSGSGVAGCWGWAGRLIRGKAPTAQISCLAVEIDEGSPRDAYDVPIAGGNASISAKIASIVINGQVFGTPAVAGDSHAFAAQVIGSLKLGGAAIPLPGLHDAFVFSDPNLNDVTVEEL